MAPHLKELYASVQGPEVRFRLPEFTYVVEHADYTTRRWPILHAIGDANRAWDWSDYPEIPFKSFVLSCSFENGPHQVHTFDLLHPRWSENPPNPRSTYGAHLANPTGFTVADNRFPGIVYDHAQLCDDQGHCSDYDAQVTLTDQNHPDQDLDLEYGRWGWLLMPLAEPFTEDVFVKDGNTTVASGYYALGPFFTKEQLRYCRILRTDRLRDHNGGYLQPPGMPLVFWGQTVELVDNGALNLWLVQAMHEPICYDPWDPGAGLRPPWAGRGVKALGAPFKPVAHPGFQLHWER